MKKSDAVFILAKLISPTYNTKELVNLFDTLKEEWELIIAIANRYLLVPALYVSLKEKNLYDGLEDKILQEYLFEIYKLNKQRNESILVQVEEICEILKDIDVKPILLKGVSALSEQHFNDNAQRSMMDIDILVPKDKIFESISLVKDYSYKEIDSSIKLGDNWHHYKRLYREDRATSLELHRFIISGKSLSYTADFNYETDTNNSKSIDNALVLEPTYEFFYTFLHSEVAHNYHDVIISLRHLHHGAIFLDKYKDVIDFKRLENYIEKYNLVKIWYEYLYLLKKLFLIDIPIEIPSMQTYENKVRKNLNAEGSIRLLIEGIFRFYNLQSKYKNLKNRYQLIYYIPLRFLELSYKTILDKNKKKAIIKALKITIKLK